MRELKIDAPDDVPQLSILNYGDTRTGKTTFGGTFPRPLIIADTTENGWKSVFTMNHANRFEPDVEPIVWGVDQINDLSMMYSRMDSLLASGRIFTIVFDAFSFYCDFYLASLIRLQGKPDNRQAYGALGLHLREVRVQLQQRRASVVYNCLASHPSEEDTKGRPMIPGQQADKFAAGVDMVFYSRLEKINKQETYYVHTRQYGKYIAGHREGINSDRLPDPFNGTYCDLITHLGYDPDAVRARLPKIGAPVAKGSVPAAVKPGVPVVKPAPVVAKPTVPQVTYVKPTVPPTNVKAPQGAKQ
jgi:hypothetical protein